MHVVRSCHLERYMQVAVFSPLLHLCVTWDQRSRAAPVRISTTKQRLRHTLGAHPPHGRIEWRQRARS